MTERYLVVGLARSGVAACDAIRRVWPEADVLAPTLPAMSTWGGFARSASNPSSGVTLCRWKD